MVNLTEEEVAAFEKGRIWEFIRELVEHRLKLVHLALESANEPMAMWRLQGETYALRATLALPARMRKKQEQKKEEN